MRWDKAAIRLTDGDLPPWTRFDATCDWCGSRASYLLDASEKPEYRDGSIYMGRPAGLTAEIVCDYHIDSRMDALQKSHGGSVGIPIRQSWRTWIHWAWAR